MKTVIIDNYDSFTYNLAHLVKELGSEVDVFRNDKIDMKHLADYDKIILSPGPGIPEEAGELLNVIKNFAGVKPILGICLGEQAIGQYFGARLINLSQVFHGVQTPIRINAAHEYLFNGLPENILVGRYHSWVVDSSQLPESIEVTSTSQEGHIMAIRHKVMDIHGLQFHPESILTPDGKTIVNHFLTGQY